MGLCAATQNPRHPLFRACLDGDEQALQLWIRRGISVNQASSDELDAGAPFPLMIASQLGHTRIVSVLLAKGATVNAQSANGSTALMLASAYGHAAIVGMLLEAGADA